MTFTREQLMSDLRSVDEWARKARAESRGDVCAVLERFAELLRQAAEAFATERRIAKEDADDTEAVRLHFFSACVAAQPIRGAECCPWTKEGICKGCPWKDAQWLFAGRQYQCLCAFSREFMADAGSVYFDDGRSKLQRS